MRVSCTYSSNHSCSYEIAETYGGRDVSASDYKALDVPICALYGKSDPAVSSEKMREWSKFTSLAAPTKKTAGATASATAATETSAKAAAGPVASLKPLAQNGPLERKAPDKPTDSASTAASGSAGSKDGSATAASGTTTAVEGFSCVGFEGDHFTYLFNAKLTAFMDFFKADLQSLIKSRL